MKPVRNNIIYLSAILLLIITGSILFTGCNNEPPITVVNNCATYISDTAISSDKIISLLLSDIHADTPDDLSIVGISLTDQIASILWERNDSIYLSIINLSDSRIFTKSVFCTGEPVLFTKLGNSRYFVIFKDSSTDIETNYSAGILNGDGTFAINEIAIPDLKNMTVNNVDIDDDGEIAIAAENSIVLLDENLSTSGTLSLSEEIAYDVAYTENHELFVLLGSNISVDNKQKFFIQVYDYDQSKPNRSLNISDKMYINSARIYAKSAGISDGIEFVSDTGIFSYSLEKNSWETKSLKPQGGIGLSSSVAYYRTTDTTRVVYGLSSMRFGQDQEGIFNLTFTKTTEKEKIRLGLTEEENTAELIELVAAVNASNAGYEIEIEIYGSSKVPDDPADDNNESLKSAQELLIAESSDQPPDLLYLSVQQTGFLIKNDALQPLDENITSESGLNINNLNKYIWDAFLIDGNRYAIAPFYRISGLAAEKDTLKNLGNYTYSNLSSMADQTGRAIAGKADDVYDILYPVLQRRLVDKDSPIHMDSNEGYGLLDDMIAFSQRYRYTNNFEQPIICSANIGSYNDFLTYSSYFQDDIAVGGYPGCADDGPLLTIPGLFAIPRNSDHSDVALTIIKKILTYSMQSQGSIYGNAGIPVRYDAFEEAICINQIQYCDQMEASNNTGIQVHSYKVTDGMQDVSYKTYRISPDDNMIKAYRDSVLAARFIFTPDSRILSITQDELEAYLNGNKSKEETAEIWDQRIDLYLEEKNG